MIYDNDMKALAWNICQQVLEQTNPYLRLEKARRLEKMYPFFKGRLANERICNHTFITLAFPQSYLEQIADVQKKLEALNYSDLQSYAYIFEFYGENGKPNFHVHMLARGKLNKKNYIRNFSRKFKLPEAKVDIRLSADEELFNTRLNYLKGIKQDGKLDSCTLNEEERKARDIEALYDRNLFSNLHV